MKIALMDADPLERLGSHHEIGESVYAYIKAGESLLAHRPVVYSARDGIARRHTDDMPKGSLVALPGYDIPEGLYGYVLVRGPGEMNEEDYRRLVLKGRNRS